MKKKTKLNEDLGYQTLSSELFMNHWNERLAQVEGLGLDASKPASAKPMAETSSHALNIKSINESVAKLTGSSFGLNESEFETECEETTEEETLEPEAEASTDEPEAVGENEDEDALWMEAAGPFLDLQRRLLDEGKGT